MFFVVAIIILVVSFLIALVSLLREQRKVHSISQRQQQSTQTANLAGDTSSTPAVSVEVPVTSLEEVTPEPVKASVPTSTEIQPAQKRVDEETVPFPWEVKSGNNVVTQPNRETARIDERPPNISNSVPSPADPEVPQVLPPQNISRASAPSLGLNGSVSLKDLKK